MEPDAPASAQPSHAPVDRLGRSLIPAVLALALVVLVAGLVAFALRGDEPLASAPAKWSLAGTLDSGRVLVLRNRSTYDACHELKAGLLSERDDAVSVGILYAELRCGDVMPAVGHIDGTVAVGLTEPLGTRQLVGEGQVCEPQPEHGAELGLPPGLDRSRIDLCPPAPTSTP